MTIQLIIDPRTVRESVGLNSSYIFAEIYFQFEYPNFFPEKGWDDFVIVILNWCIEGSISICHNDISSICRFMEGPYYFKLTPRNDNFEISFFSNFDKEQFVFSDVMQKIEFFKLLLKGTYSILRVISEKKIYSEEVARLESNYKQLQKLVKKMS